MTQWAAFNGHLQFLKTLRNIRCISSWALDNLMFYAIKGGHTHILKCMEECNNYIFRQAKERNKDKFMATGCWSGKLDILEFLKDKDLKLLELKLRP